MSVVVVSYNVKQLLAACLASVLRQRAACNLDVWLVDNASADGSLDMARRDFPTANIIANTTNRGYGAACNQGIAASSGRYVLILNPDTDIVSGSLGKMVPWMDQHPKTGLAGPRLIYADGSFQHSCFRFPGLGQALLDQFPIHPRLLNGRLNGRYSQAAYAHPMDVDVCLGACFLLRRAAGLTFDEAYFMYVEEIDLCWRLRQAGWVVSYVPELTVLHHAGQSTRQVAPEMRRQLYRSRRLFNARYRGRLFRAAWETIARAGGAPSAAETGRA